MLAWYWREDQAILNFGEHITPYILNYHGVKWKNWSRRSEEDKECILIIGSELHKATMQMLKESGINKIHIWGQGKGTGNNFNQAEYSVEFYLVRGEETKKQLKLDASIPTGDPAFVMPLICDVVKRQKINNIIYIPHHTHRSNIKEKQEKWLFNEYIDIMIHSKDFINTLNKIVNAQFVMTTSLHVSIICMAYNVPFCVIVDDKEKLNYYPEKWKDVFDWAGINFKICKSFNEGVDWWKGSVKDSRLPDANEILHTFPKFIFS